MKANRITVEDIKGIGTYGKLSVELPSYLAAISAKNLVYYVNKAYKRDDGLRYSTAIDLATNTLTISTVDKK